MNVKLRFVGDDGSPTTGAEWLVTWSLRYPSAKYEQDHDALLAKKGAFVGRDFELIGRWKDAAQTDRKWKPDVASVAYRIWMEAVREVPTCPSGADTIRFLKDWAGRRYVDEYASRTVEKRFGLSRATALLYFLSGGQFPIFDSRVRTAIRRLTGETIGNTPECYIEGYIPLMSLIAEACGTKDLRLVDKALFAYGGKRLPNEIQQVR